MTSSTNKQSPLSFTLTRGIYLALISIAITLIIWLGKLDINFGIFTSFVIHFINLIITVLFITYCTGQYRDQILNGQIKYGKAFSFGVMVYLSSTIITNFFNLILYRYIDPSYLQRVLEAYREHLYQWMVQYNTPQTQIDQTMDLLKPGKIPTPMETLEQSFINGVFGGAILSLFTAAFVKKKSKVTENIDQQSQF